MNKIEEEASKQKSMHAIFIYFLALWRGIDRSMLSRTCPPLLAVVVEVAADAGKGGQAVLQLHGSAAHPSYHGSPLPPS